MLFKILFKLQSWAVLRIRIGFSADLNHCRYMRIRILVRLCRRKKLDLYIKNILYVGNMS
jgi:hypothetical protein